MMNGKNISSIGKRCTGCGTCSLVCPTKAITMKSDQEGFLAPSIDESICISCQNCLGHCPQNNESSKPGIPQVGYAAVLEDKEKLFDSASGGVGYGLSLSVLKEGGIVYGCVYLDNKHVSHVRIDKIDDLAKTQSSKYVQSRIVEILPLLKKDVMDRKKVLFIGTPCQVDAICFYLGKEYENLILVDLICHGVPSPLLFEKYITYLEKKRKTPVEQYNFRSKKGIGWGLYYYYYYGKKHDTNSLDIDPYGYAFLNGIDYRESCYTCKYASLDRVSDLTIGDFWGIEKTNLKYSKEEGVSCVIVNTKKGKDFLLRTDLTLQEASLDQIVPSQKNLQGPTLRDSRRDGFYDGIQGDFDTYRKKKLSVPMNMKTILKKVLPTSVKKRLKH